MLTVVVRMPTKCHCCFCEQSDVIRKRAIFTIVLVNAHCCFKSSYCFYKIAHCCYKIAHCCYKIAHFFFAQKVLF
jgi:hypothetical protein